MFCRFRRKTSGIADSLGKMVRKQVNTIFGLIEDFGCFFLCRKYFLGVFFHVGNIFWPFSSNVGNILCVGAVPWDVAAVTANDLCVCLLHP